MQIYIFPLAVGYLFTLFIVLFDLHTFLVLMKFNLSTFCCLCFSLHIWEITASFCHEDFPLFSSNCFIFNSYVLVLDPFWVNFCIWRKVRAQLHSFAYGYPVVPAPSVLGPLNCLALLSSVLLICICLSLCQYHTVLIIVAL